MAFSQRPSLVVDSGWEPAQMLDRIRSAIADNPDAICVLGHPGDAVITPLVEEAAAIGILLTCHKADGSASAACGT